MLQNFMLQLLTLQLSMAIAAAKGGSGGGGGGGGEGEGSPIAGYVIGAVVGGTCVFCVLGRRGVRIHLFRKLCECLEGLSACLRGRARRI